MIYWLSADRSLVKRQTRPDQWTESRQYKIISRRWSRGMGGLHHLAGICKCSRTTDFFGHSEL